MLKICESKSLKLSVYAQAWQLLQRFLNAKSDDLDQSVQAYALACLCLASKLQQCSVPLNKFLKFTAYKLSAEKLAAAELEVF